MTHAATTTGKGGEVVITTFPAIIIASLNIWVFARPRMESKVLVKNAMKRKPIAIDTKMRDTMEYPIL